MLLCPPARATSRTSLEQLAIKTTSLDADEFSSSDDEADDTSPPKRKSLTKRIDTDHPGSRSARLARRPGSWTPPIALLAQPEALARDGGRAGKQLAQLWLRQPVIRRVLLI